MKIFFARKSEMTAYAEQTGLEYARTKQTCNHCHYPRPAIFIIKHDRIIERLVKCKPCAEAAGKELNNE